MITAALKKASFIWIFFLLYPVFSQTLLDPQTLDKVQSSVFEVIVEKPSEGSIEYERSLPFSRLAFSIRNDKYLPLGTAFLTSEGKFYSASHVFKLYEDTVYTDYYIRDKNGSIYKIDEVTKFSTNRDFISFTVKNYKIEKGSGLTVTENTVLNSQVFSVGNALGDGIVIRNGVLTSQTYETEDGEWKWLRFSAAASPGNSGGPLISTTGEVLGIITMKSENENLNYALPFSEVNQVPDNTGTMKQTFYYSLPNIFSEKFYHKFMTEMPLPAKLEDVQKKITSDYKTYTAQLVEGLRKQFNPLGKKGFGSASGWQEMMSNFYMTNFPYTVYLTENNTWQYGSMSKTYDYQLENNGLVTHGGMMGYTMGVIRKPESMTLSEFISNPKQYMEYMVRATNLYRTVAGENVSITSLGEPSRSEQYIDYFERTWLVNYWDLDFADSMIISYSLPLPEGLFIVYDIDSTGDILNGISLDMPFFADFIYPSYIGTLQNWKEYLELSETLSGKKPPFMEKFTVSLNDANVIINNGAMGFNLPLSIFPADKNTRLRATSSYSFKDDKLVIEVKSFDLYTSRTAENYRYVYLSKNLKPSVGAVKNTMDKWLQKRNRVSPYNGLPYNYESYTYLDKIFYPTGVTYETREQADTIYLLACELDGQNRFDEMKIFAEAVEKTVILP